MFLNETLALQVKTGPLAGCGFNNLIEFVEARQQFEDECPHEHTRRAQVVSGLASDKCYHTVAIVCRRCRKVLESNRRPVTHEEGQRIAEEIGQR